MVMKRGFGIAGTAVTAASLLFLFASSAAGGSHAGFRGNRQAAGGPASSVAQPSTIALLGAGLVALGFYAKRKNHKKS
jgi:hypothetical protein